MTRTLHRGAAAAARGFALAATLTGPAALPAHAMPDPSREAIATSLCAALKGAVGAAVEPVLLPSFEPGPHEDALPPFVAGAAHVYDNALAVIALLACDETAAALLIADALSLAAGDGGRLANAYMAGSARGAPVPLGAMTDGGWHVDAYAAGLTTGNAAWVALAFLRTHTATSDPRWLGAAQTVMRWVLDAATARVGLPGFTGGLAWRDGAVRPVTWKSTEHNTDVAAAAAWLGRATGDGRFVEAAADAAFFVTTMLQDDGRVLIGTLSDGVTPNRETLALDAALWPVLAGLVPGARVDAVLSMARSDFGVPGGVDYNNDRDGLWVEGTAQLAAVLHARGHEEDALELLGALMAHDRAESGVLYATRPDVLSTGFALADGTPRTYTRRPHLGTTAWATLAATGTNPFVPPATATAGR